MRIKFEIRSRGTMLVEYGEKKLIIHGELTFEPPVFYAGKDSIKNWESPFETDIVSEIEKKEIIDFIKENEMATLVKFE